MDGFVPDKKCPFCAYTGNRIEAWEVRGHIEYAVMCLNCGALGPNDLGKSGAVEMWDIRREEYPGPTANEVTKPRISFEPVYEGYLGFHPKMKA